MMESRRQMIWSDSANRSNGSERGGVALAGNQPSFTDHEYQFMIRCWRIQCTARPLSGQTILMGPQDIAIAGAANHDLLIRLSRFNFYSLSNVLVDAPLQLVFVGLLPRVKLVVSGVCLSRENVKLPPQLLPIAVQSYVWQR